MNHGMSLYTLLFWLALFSPAHADNAVSPDRPVDYWVDYQVTELTRAKPTDSWSQVYSEPFGVRTGYGSGIVLSDHSITDPSQPNCYSFTFTAVSADGMASLDQELEVSRYHGDNFCGPIDPDRIEVLATLDETVLQKHTTTLQLPFLAGQEVKIELTPRWKPAP